MAGSNIRSNVQGHTVMGQPAALTLLRRLASTSLTQLFLHAKEQGQANVLLNDQPFTLQRHSDHTFTLVAGESGHTLLP